MVLSDSMTTCTKVSFPFFMVFVEESLHIIICNSLSVGIRCGVSKSKSICDSTMVLVDTSIMKQNCFQHFTIRQYQDKKRRTPALLDNPFVFCSSISKFVLKAAENTILWLEIHRRQSSVR